MTSRSSASSVLLLVVILLAPLALCQKRGGTSTASIDYFSNLDNPSVSIPFFKALDFGASVLNFRRVDTTTPVNLQTPGSATFKSQTITFGGSTNTGPLSIDGGAGEIEITGSDVSLNAATGLTLNVEGASASIASPSIQIEAPAGTSSFTANRVTLYAESAGIVVASNAAISFAAGPTFTGRVSVEGSKVSVLGKSGVTVSAAQAFVATGHRNVDVIGNVVSLTSSATTDVTVPAGNVYYDASQQISVQSTTGSLSLQGDSGVLLGSVRGTTALNGGVTTISSQGLVQVLSDIAGTSITSTTGDVKFSSSATVSVGSGGPISLASSGVVSLAGTTLVSVQSQGTVSFSGTTSTTALAPDIAVRGYGISSNSTAATQIAGSNEVTLRAVGSINLAAGTTFGFSPPVSLLIGSGESSIVNAKEVRYSGTPFAATSGCDIRSQTSGVLTLAGTAKVQLLSNNGAAALVAGSLTAVGSSTLTSTSGSATRIVGSTSVTLDGTTSLTFNVGNNAYFYTDTGGLQASLTGAAAFTTANAFSIDSTKGTTTIKASTGASFDGQQVTISGDTVRLTATAKDVSLISTQALSASFLGSVTLAAKVSGTIASTELVQFSNSGLDITFNGALKNSASAPVTAHNAVENLRAEAKEALSIQANSGIYSQSGVNTVITAQTGLLSVSAAKTAIYNSNGNITATSGGALSLTTATAPGTNAAFFGADRFELVAASDVQLVSRADQLTVSTTPNSESSINLSAVRDGLFSDAASTKVTAAAGSVSFSGAASASVRATQQATITSRAGGDIVLASDGDLSSTVGDSLTITGGTVRFAAVQHSTRDGSLFSSAQALSLKSQQDDLFSRASRGYAASAGGILSTAAASGDVSATGSDLVQVTGGEIHVNAGTSAILKAQGGGVFFSTGRFPDVDNQTFSDIQFTATKNVLANAARNVTFANFKGVLTGTAVTKVQFSGGYIRQTTGTAQTFLLRGAGGVNVATADEESMLFKAGNDFLTTVQKATSLTANGVSQLNQDGMLFRATKNNVCVATGPDATTFDFSGARGVLIETTQDGANVTLNASFDLATNAAGSIGLSSYGWSFDPLDVAGLRIPLGVLLRTTAQGGSIKLQTTTPSADIELRALHAVNFTSTTAPFTVTSTGSLDVRTTGYLGDINLLTFSGVVKATASQDTFFRAGTRSLDADLMANATQGLSLTATTGNILFQQLGTNSDTVTNGISVFSEKGHMAFTASNGIFSIDTRDGHGTVNITAETLGMTINAATDIVLQSNRAFTILEGQTSASLVSTTKAIALSAQGAEGSLTISSAGLADVEFLSGTGTTVFSATKYDVSLDALTGVVGSTNQLAVQGGDDTVVSAGGSLSLIASNTIGLTALRTDLFSVAEMRIDTPGVISTLVTGQSPLVRINAGGDEAQEGIKVQSSGNVQLSSNTDARLYGNYVAVTSGDANLFQSTNGDVSVITQSQRGGSIAVTSLGGPVSLQSTAGQVSLSSSANYLVSTNTKVLNTATATIALRAAKQIDYNAPTPSGVVTFESDKAIGAALTDMFITTAGTVSIEALDLVQLQAENYVSFIANTGALSAVTDNTFTIKTVAAQSPIRFETTGTSSTIKAQSAKTIATTTTGAISLAGSNGVTLQSTTDAISLTTTKDRLSLKADNIIAYTSQLELTTTSTNSDTTFASGNTLDITALKGVTMTSASNVVADISGAIRVTDSDVLSSITAVSGGISTYSKTDTIISSTPFKATAANWIDLTSNGRDPAISTSAMAFVATTTATLTATNGAIRLDSQHDINWRAFTTSQISAKASATYEATGPDGISVTSAGTMSIVAPGDSSITGAVGVSVSATQALLADVANDVSLTTTNGDIFTTADSALKVQATTATKVIALDRGFPNQGVISVLTQASSGLKIDGKLTFFAGDTIDAIASTGLVSIADGTTNLIARNSLTFQSFSDAVPGIKIAASTGTTATSAADINIFGRGGAVSLKTTAGDHTFTATSDTTVLAGTLQSTALAHQFLSAASLSFTANEGSLEIRRGANSDIKLDSTSSANFAATEKLSVLGKVVNGADSFVDGLRVRYNGIDIKGTQPTFTASDSIFFNPTTSFSSTSVGSGSQTLTTTGPQSDIKLYVDSGALTIRGSDLIISADLNLGPIEGMISTKEYNYHGVEFIAIEGGVSITTQVAAVTSHRGAVQYRAQNEVCYGTSNAGDAFAFFGQTPATRATLSAQVTTDLNAIIGGADLCANVNAIMRCPQWSNTIRVIASALRSYNIIL